MTLHDLTDAMEAQGHQIICATFYGPTAWKIRAVSVYTGQEFEVRSSAITGTVER